MPKLAKRDCEIRACVNPQHLFLGTRSDNLKDAFRKGRITHQGIRNPRHHSHRGATKCHVF